MASSIMLCLPVQLSCILSFYCCSSPTSQLSSSPSDFLKFTAVALTTSPTVRRCKPPHSYLPTLLAPLTLSGASSPAIFILSNASTPIPGKLADNIALMERLEAFPPHVGQALRQQAIQTEVASIRS